MIDRLRQFYIDGAWVAPSGSATHALIDPTTEAAYAELAMGSTDDVDRAVAAAHRAFAGFSTTSVEERKALLARILAIYELRADEFARLVTREIGAPIALTRAMQVPGISMMIAEQLRVLDSYRFEEPRDGYTLRREAIGVCGLITPWNWPLHQLILKVAPALAAGCTMVLKPSENAALDALLFAEVAHEAGVPAGVFNLVNGDGATVGTALSRHPDVALVSFTGSTRAGVAVAKNAADTIKRVTQELGGKSANIVLPDADLESAVATGVTLCFRNSGQSCNAPTRLLVPADRHDEALAIARACADAVRVGDPLDDATELGPVATAAQFEKIQALIAAGINEGATLVAGGLGRPAHLPRGFYVRPTVFGHVTNAMTIAREEIFGPVLSILPYRDEADAIAIANDTPYGLAAYVQSHDVERARRVAAQLRAGNVMLNYAPPVPSMPFGGYKQSGNGREWSTFGLEEFLELKAVVGPAAA